MTPGPATPHALRLLRTISELTGARDLEAVMTIVGSAARDLTGADGASFVLRDGDTCFYAGEQAIGPLWKGQRFPMEACLSGWVMTHRQAAVVTDIRDDPRVPRGVYDGTFVESVAIVPIRQGDPIGALGAYWATPHTCGDDELTLLISLADSAALAVTNVRLFDELRSAIDRERDARVAAEAAAAAKNEFLALVAHELRQPLHASLAALRLMELRTSLEQGQHAREIVARQLTLMNGLAEDLVHAARIVGGRVALERTAIDLGAAARHAAESVRPLMAESRHELTVEVPPEPAIALADEPRLQQVLMNLLANAAKYTDPGGRIRLTLRTDGEEATITVADNGRGIDADHLPLIFELFARGAGDGHGFGVGLAVARKLIDMHGGTITARSAGTGSGSEFHVRLPLLQGESAVL